MRISSRVGASVGLLLFALASQAFEPGHDKVCTPSADGQSFECRDKSETSAPEVKSKPVEPRPAASTPVPAQRVSESAPPPNQLPNYLMQNPSDEPSAGSPESTPVEASAAIESPSSSDASATPTVETTAAAESIPSDTTTPTSTAAPSSGALAPLASEPEPAAAAVSTPAIETPAEKPQPVAVEQAAKSPAAARSNLPGASEFLSLPASHYTLVVTSVRNAAALDALIVTLADLPGQLYLLKLGMPDGVWYSLCWSNFADLDAARAARFSLPSDAAITSGWPRRIGLLQQELTR